MPTKKKTAKKKSAPKNKGGRPTDYKVEYNDLAFKFTLLGATDMEMAEFFEVEEKTLNNWKIKHPKFLQSIRNGKEKADAEVGHSLYQRANGYSHPEDKIFCNDGVVTTVETTKHYPPDTKAAIHWLNNRRPKDWRERQEVNLTNLSPAELLEGIRKEREEKV